MKIAVIGSAMMDVVSYVDRIPKAGETRSARGFHIACGGKGANQAVAAGRLGADVAMVACVGDDLFGGKVLESLKKAGVATDCVQRAQGVANGIATILVEESGQNRILIHRGANDCLTPEAFAACADKLADCSLFVLQMEIPLETNYAAIRYAKAHGIEVLLNPAPATEELDLAMACQCDFFAPNETELSILTKMPTDTVEQVRRAAKSLLAHGMKHILVTMGGRGSLYVAEGREELIPAEKVTAVDTTGAGDAYIGAFVAHYAETGEILPAMRRASRYAAISVTRKGTQDSYLEKAAFERLLAQT